jgi:(+)-neomenthol dehydrogenase
VILECFYCPSPRLSSSHFYFRIRKHSGSDYRELRQCTSFLVNNSYCFLEQNFNSEELKKEFTDIDNLTEKRLEELLDLFLEDFKTNLIEAHGWPTGGSSAYKVAKAALNAYTRILAKKYPTMRINCLTPGYVKSDMSMHMGVLTPEDGASNPVKVALLPDDGPTGSYFDRDGEASFV